MDMILDSREMSFADVEAELFRVVGWVVAQLMREWLEAKDDELYEERDAERFKVVSKRERTIDTLLGWPTTFRRRYYHDGLTQKSVYLLDESLGLDESSRASPGLRNLSVILAVISTSYRKAAESLERAYGQKVLSHEAIRQYLIDAGREESKRIEEELEQPGGRRRAPIVFCEADGLNVHLQRTDKRRVEEKILTVHEGWKDRPGCAKGAELVNKSMYSSDEDREWWDGASRFVYSKYDLSDETVVVINADRDRVYRKGVEWFGNNKVLYQVDRYHLKRDLKRIVKDKDKLMQLMNKADEDPTGQCFIEALEAEAMGLRGKDKKDMLEFIKDLRPIAESVCDYRVRLKAEGVNIEGLRGLGAAEAELDVIADRLKKLGRSWSRTGARAMTALLCARQSGRLDEAVARGLERKRPVLAPGDNAKANIVNIPESALTRARDALSCRLPAIYVGRTKSGGMSEHLRKVQSGGVRI